MTSLTIELTPDIYERLRAEAQRQGKAEQVLAQELLTGQLQESTPTEEPLYIQMLPQIRALAATVNPDDLIVPGKATPEEAIALFHSWTEDDDENDDEDNDGEYWEDVLRSIDANRGYRKLFADLEQPNELLRVLV